MALEADYRIETFAEAETALAAIIKDPPDLILLDIGLPGMSGIEVTEKLRQEGLSIPILVLSSHNDWHFILSLFRMGISGYLAKDEAPANITQAVRAIANGQGGWISQRMAAAIAMRLEGDQPGNTRLSELDRQVLYLLSIGKTSEEISASLGVKPKKSASNRSISPSTPPAGTRRAVRWI